MFGKPHIFSLCCPIYQRYAGETVFGLTVHESDWSRRGFLDNLGQLSFLSGMSTNVVDATAVTATPLFLSNVAVNVIGYLNFTRMHIIFVLATRPGF